MQNPIATTPNGFPIHTIESAPEASKPLLSAVASMFGGNLPNLFAVLGHNPLVLEANLNLFGIQGKLSLTPTETQIIDLSISHQNNCTYCTAAHTFLSRRLPDQDALEAARNGQPITDPKLSALRDFAVELVKTAGHVNPETAKRFHDAGYTREQALEVIHVVGFKNIQNYVNSLADTPVDAMFA